MKTLKRITPGALILCAVLAITLSFAAAVQIRAETTVPGAGVGASDGDRDGDGMIEGPVSDEKTPAEQAASDIGDSVSRGIEDAKDKAEELASDAADKMAGEDGGQTENDGSHEPMDTVWVIVAVIALIAIVAAIVIAVPGKGKKRD